MRNFFIDLENVRSYGLEGILLLKPEDKVYVFYSDNANTLTIPTIESLNESSATVKYIKTNYTGANAMDFQIVTLLGASIEKEREGRFYIISHDNGFKSAVKFCEGYFTGYDIVTGVFANILLAINSEKNGTNPRNAQAVQEEKKDRRKRNDKNSSGIKEQKTEEISGSSDESVPGIENSDSEEKTVAPKKNGRRRRRSGQKANDIKKTEQSVNEQVIADPEPGNEPDTGNSPEESDGTKNTGRAKGRDRRRRKNPKPVENTEAGIAENPEEKTVTNSESDREETKNQGKRRRRGRGRDKASEKPAAGVSVQNNESEKNDSEDSKKSGNYKYVYNALSDFLSKKTIDMYVSKIDEGIRKSGNRNELHEFFKKSYGKDEAEALYKIICSDFEKMKKEAGK